MSLLVRKRKNLNFFDILKVLNRSMDPKTYEPAQPPLITQIQPVQMPLLPQVSVVGRMRLASSYATDKMN